MSKVKAFIFMLANNKAFGFRLVLKPEKITELTATTVLKAARLESEKENELYRRTIEFSNGKINLFYQKLIAKGNLIDLSSEPLTEKNEFGHEGRPLYTTIGILITEDVKSISEAEFQKLINFIKPYYKKYYYWESFEETFNIGLYEIEVNDNTNPKMQINEQESYKVETNFEIEKKKADDDVSPYPNTKDNNDRDKPELEAESPIQLDPISIYKRRVLILQIIIIILSILLLVTWIF